MTFSWDEYRDNFAPVSRRVQPLCEFASNMVEKTNQDVHYAFEQLRSAIDVMAAQLIKPTDHVCWNCERWFKQFKAYGILTFVRIDEPMPMPNLSR
jgi:hypothetical protein